MSFDDLQFSPLFVN